MSFASGNKVTVVMNPQCHGVVIESDADTATVKLDHFPVVRTFKTSELKSRNNEQQPQS